MALPTARKDSNAPDLSADNEPSTGELGMVGFTRVPYEAAKPAMSNRDVQSSGDNKRFEMGNDGTSREAYEYQPDIINSETLAELSVASKDQGHGK